MLTQILEINGCMIARGNLDLKQSCTHFCMQKGGRNVAHQIDESKPKYLSQTRFMSGRRIIKTSVTEITDEKRG